MLSSEINLLIDNEQFYHHYQPLYCLTSWNKIGFEALFRSTLFENPEIAFKSARNTNRLYELELKSITKAIFGYSKTEIAKIFNSLFVNVFPSTISNPNFPEFLTKIISETVMKSEQIILEINEAEVVLDVFLFKKGLGELRNRGFLFAIDDVGKGSASLRSIIELKPNFVKMDRYFAFNLSNSEQKQEMIKSVLTYCQNTETYFVLEGIENKNDLAVAKALGVSCGQGFLLGKPSRLEDIV